jgi:CheY-like chemotaxis protein/anti-sigma regulatory factor (Ser/Thr protein kinase)
MGSLNEERAAANAEVQAIRETAASVAHGLNNLLGSVVGLAAQLVDTADPAAPSTEIRLIQQAALDSLTLTRRLLHLSRGEQALAPDSLDLVDMGRVLADAVDLTRPFWHDRARQHGRVIVPNLEVERDRPLLVRGVASDLREIVGNLIHNAVDAMPHGGRLRLRGTIRDGAVLVACQDNGNGMAAEVRARIFDPFYTTKGERGTGLGLAIARSVVARFGGDLHVSSEVGVGTTVTLRLPAAEVATAASTTVHSAQTAHSAQTMHSARARATAATAMLVGAVSGPNGANGRHGHHDVAWEKPTIALCSTVRRAAADALAATLATLSILVVDDDPVFRGVFSRRLRLDARHVEAVADARSALVALELNRWDVLCVDDGLPDRSGRALAAEIRRRGLPCGVVLVTGTAATPGDPSLAGPGVDAILPKPCTDAELARALRHAQARQAERSSAVI